jgi:cell division protein FtsB
VYLGVHAWTGPQGVRNHLVIKSEIEETRAELDLVRDRRMAMEDRVARLDERVEGGGVDADYLEERARAVLRFAHPDEVVVTLDAQPRH